MKYHVNATVTGGKYLGKYEADSPEEAVEKALSGDAACVYLCHQCSGECEDAEISDATAKPAEEPPPEAKPKRERPRKEKS